MVVNGFGCQMLVNRSKVTAAIIVAFAILYDYYLLSGYFGWFLDEHERKAYIYSVVMAYVCSLIWMGNSNAKSKSEIAFRKIATCFFSLFCFGVILTNLCIINYPLFYCLLFCSLTIILVFFFIFKADKEGNI